MRLADSSQLDLPDSSSPWTPAQREAILAEMNRLLEAPAFRKSQRCVTLLRAMVEHALSKGHEGIKERTLGIEVFGRDADYDSNADPVVRMTANEIRKRLAQSYQDSDTQPAVRIRLQPGSYLLEFDFSGPDAASPHQHPEHAQADSTLRKRLLFASFARILCPLRRFRWLIAATLLLLLIFTGFLFYRSNRFKRTQDLVWAPLLQSGNPIVITVADNADLEHKGEKVQNDTEQKLKVMAIASMIESRKIPAPSDPEDFHPVTPFADAHVAHEVAHWLGIHKQSSLLFPASKITPEQFHNKPMVLIGGLDNPWTVIMLSDLRFSPRVDPGTGVLWIRDARNPSSREWSHYAMKNSKRSFDYAVLTRFWDVDTGNWILAIGGLGVHGTIAASQLILDPAYERSLPEAMRTARNFQIIVRTNIINGNAGPPQIVAFDNW